MTKLQVTPDPTLQRLIAQLLPLVGIGNFTLTVGLTSWSMVGAQGRYRLATFVNFMTTWLVTLPLAATFVYAANYNLEGIVSAIVVGYSATGTVLLYILLQSDWERLSKCLIEINAAEESSGADDSEVEVIV